MDDIRFCHLNKHKDFCLDQSYTFAIKFDDICVADYEPMMTASLRRGIPFSVGIGVARCHPEDNFCKKTGREISLKNMKPVLMQITQFRMFRNNDGKYQTVIVMEGELLEGRKGYLTVSRKRGHDYRFNIELG